MILIAILVYRTLGRFPVSIRPKPGTEDGWAIRAGVTT
jgi:hypothetical protein